MWKNAAKGENLDKISTIQSRITQNENALSCGAKREQKGSKKARKRSKRERGKKEEGSNVLRR